MELTYDDAILERVTRMEKHYFNGIVLNMLRIRQQTATAGINRLPFRVNSNVGKVYGGVESLREMWKKERAARGEDRLTVNVIFCADRDKIYASNLSRYVLYSVLDLREQCIRRSVSFSFRQCGTHFCSKSTITQNADRHDRCRKCRQKRSDTCSQKTDQISKSQQ